MVELDKNNEPIIFDVNNLEVIKERMTKTEPQLPCNIWRYIKYLENRIAELGAQKL